MQMSIFGCDNKGSNISLCPLETAKPNSVQFNYFK